jgi:hypothetical protein
MPWHQPWTQKRQTTLKAMDAWRHHCTAPSLIALDLTHLKYPSHQWSCWNGLPSSSWGRVVVLPAACLLDPSTACTLSQWQIMSTQVRQQDGAQPPSSNNPAGLLPNPGKWAMVLGPNRPKVGQADLTKSPGRDLPFGAIFLILMDQYPRDRAGCLGDGSALGDLPFWSCGAVCVASPKEEIFLALWKSTWRKNWNHGSSSRFLVADKNAHSIRYSWHIPNVIRVRHFWKEHLPASGWLNLISESQERDWNPKIGGAKTTSSDHTLIVWSLIRFAGRSLSRVVTKGTGLLCPWRNGIWRCCRFMTCRTSLCTFPL